MEQSPEKKKKKSKVLALVKITFLSFFPWLKIISMNSNLKKAAKFVHSPWFKKQIWRNRLVSLLLALPLFFGLALSSKIIAGDKNLGDGISKTIEYVQKGKIKTAWKMATYTLKKDDTQRRIELSFYIFFGFILFSSFFGWIIIIFHPILKETKVFVKDLKYNGIIKDDAKNLVIATPVGYLVKITGNATARSIMDNDAIWVSQNVRVNDYLEDPNNRAIVFYQKAYKLQELYTYEGVSV